MCWRREGVITGLEASTSVCAQTSAYYARKRLFHLHSSVKKTAVIIIIIINNNNKNISNTFLFLWATDYSINFIHSNLCNPYENSVR